MCNNKISSIDTHSVEGYRFYFNTGKITHANGVKVYLLDTIKNLPTDGDYTALWTTSGLKNKQNSSIIQSSG